MLAPINTKDLNGLAPGPRTERAGGWFIRYALFLVIFWIGCLKFTAYESQGVFMHASHSPLLAWAYDFLDVRNFSRALGTVEIIIALLIAIRPVLPKLSALGSLGAIAMFLTTLSFLFSDPGVWQSGYGFPALAGNPGQFLIKDAVLLGSAIWTLGESLNTKTTQLRDLTQHGSIAGKPGREDKDHQ